MSIGLPFTRILHDAWKLEFQERWSGLEVAAVGNSSSEVLTGLIGDGIWGSELAQPTDLDPASRQCLGYEPAHPALTALCQKSWFSQFLWHNF